ncbi:DNA polymerase III subunit psi [Blochmannia endosymbiont of Camponotus sp.]|uniref:DNA polymerase III subunit psi n=1 Tax=Blochmannia endosymbiont of Camponotus sp. TaxID=700220 RepID=UPI00202433F3|nr:DNA polymerase III subunit psi [Blochmannia endosymbiont of Camponotus sp.]URJ31409.1 DNA polymerase III subunit psi [Blochmannia endosymbiont of Camponotus sp.]
MWINNEDRQNNFILQQLGITLWKLRYPVVLNNNNQIKLCKCLRLLLISSDSPISLNDLFIKDVIRATQFNPKEVYALTNSQINHLIIPSGFSCHCWWIGTEVSKNFHGMCLNTPSLPILKSNVKAKRDLWRQISCIKFNI